MSMMLYRIWQVGVINEPWSQTQSQPAHKVGVSIRFIERSTFRVQIINLVKTSNYTFTQINFVVSPLRENLGLRFRTERLRVLIKQ